MLKDSSSATIYGFVTFGEAGGYAVQSAPAANGPYPYLALYSLSLSAWRALIS